MSDQYTPHIKATKSDFAKTMKMHEYKAGLYYRAAKLKGPEFFMQAAALCASSDRALKSGGSGGDGYAILERLICTLCDA